MRRNIIAALLAFAVLGTQLPAAATQSQQQIQTNTGADIAVLYENTVSDEIGILSAEDIPADAEVIKPQTGTAFQRQYGASGRGETTEAVFQLQHSDNNTQDIFHSEKSAGTTTDFTTYGAQLSQVRFTANGMYFDDLSEPLKQLYASARKELEKGTNSAFFTGDSVDLYNHSIGFYLGGVSDQTRRKLAQQLIWMAYLSLDYDCPEMFYSNGYCKTEVYIEGSYIVVTMIPLFTEGFMELEDRISLKQKLDAKTQEVVKLAEAYPTAYEKLCFLKDWLCENNEYNEPASYEYNYSTTVSGHPWSSVSAMLSSSDASVDRPVCEGYSRALQLLCQKIGISAVLVTSGSGVHMWNNVRYGEYWTGIDVTFLDSGGTDENYFCALVNEMDYTHLVDDSNFVDWMNYPELSIITGKEILPFYDKLTWQKPAVQYMYENGYINGMTCVDFGVTQNLTRAQFVQLLYNKAGRPICEYSERFTDVPEDKWYTNACTWAAQENMIAGYPDGSFGVNTNITRQEIAAILFRMYGSIIPEEGWQGTLQTFGDWEETQEWAMDAMNWMADNAIYIGDNHRMISPRANATRGEAAQLLMCIWTTFAEE